LEEERKKKNPNPRIKKQQTQLIKPPNLDLEHPITKKFEQLALNWNALMFPKQFKFLRDC